MFVLKVDGKGLRWIINVYYISKVVFKKYMLKMYI